MRRRSLSPPRWGCTHSRYSPPCTTTVSPGRAIAAARPIVRNGWSSEPSAESDPVVATWSSAGISAPLVLGSDSRGGTGHAFRVRPGWLHVPAPQSGQTWWRRRGGTDHEFGGQLDLAAVG